MDGDEERARVWAQFAAAALSAASAPRADGRSAKIAAASAAMYADALFAEYEDRWGEDAQEPPR